MDAAQVVYDETVPLATYDRLFADIEPLPLLGKNDLDLLFDYLLLHSPTSMKLKIEWDRASSEGEQELFLNSLTRIVGRRGLPVRIVRTKENGTKTVTDLRNGFVSLMFDSAHL